MTWAIVIISIATGLPVEVRGYRTFDDCIIGMSSYMAQRKPLIDLAVGGCIKLKPEDVK